MFFENNTKISKLLNIFLQRKQPESGFKKITKIYFIFVLLIYSKIE